MKPKKITAYELKSLLKEFGFVRESNNSNVVKIRCEPFEIAFESSQISLHEMTEKALIILDGFLYPKNKTKKLMGVD